MSAPKAVIPNVHSFLDENAGVKSKYRYYVSFYIGAKLIICSDIKVKYFTEGDKT